MKTLTVHAFGTPSAEVIVWLHGFMGTGRDIEHLAASLTERTGCHLICPDLPGHGDSRRVVPSSLERAADAVLEAVQSATGAERFHLVGYSMGGRVALTMAARHPDVVDRLILESTHFGINHIRRRAHRLAADRKASRKLASCHTPLAFRAFLVQWYRSDVFMFEGEPPADMEDRIASRMHQDPGMLAKALLAFSTGVQPDLADVAKSKVTGFICGARDRKYVEIANEVFRGEERRKVLVVEDAGHTVHRDAPGAYLDAVCSLINPISICPL